MIERESMDVTYLCFEAKCTENGRCWDIEIYAVLELHKRMRESINQLEIWMGMRIPVTLCSVRWRYRNSLTASASKAAWKNEIVFRKAQLPRVSRLTNRPVNSKLFWWK